MDGLEFISVAPPLGADPARADIALFIGWVARRSAGLERDRARLEQCLRAAGWRGSALPARTPLLPPEVVPGGASPQALSSWLDRVAPPPSLSPSPKPTRLSFETVLASWFNESLARWFVDRGWLDPAAGRSALDLLELRDVPVPIESWEAFDALFAWDQRPVDASVRRCDTLLGASVRSFFAQGGRLCYVVRLADPFAVLATTTSRRNAIERVKTPQGLSAADRSSWRGLGHLFGLPEVSLLCVPDLPDLFAADSPVPRFEEREPSEEKFVECSERREPDAFPGLRAISPPRCEAAGFQAWSGLVGSIGEFVSRYARETQFIAALPLPVQAGASRTERGRAIEARRAQLAAIDRLQTVFVQLVFPWLRTVDSAAVPGELEPPDGALAGMIANQALTFGAWRTVARTGVRGIQAVEPVLTQSELALREWVSVFGPTSRGFELLSDVTTATGSGGAWTPANINRLMNIIVRAARQAGEEFAFAGSGERLWSQLRAALDDRLAQLWADGALEGATREEAFNVRCDRTTMTQADLDAGRAIVRVEFSAARPIERICVVLAMAEGGQVSLVSRNDKTAGAPADLAEVS